MSCKRCHKRTRTNRRGLCGPCQACVRWLKGEQD